MKTARLLPCVILIDAEQPIIVCQLKGNTVLVDGFKRLHASSALKGISTLSGRRLEVDEQGATSVLMAL